MPVRYKAIRTCLVNGKRFRMGEYLPEGLEPNNHFMAEGEADREIKKHRSDLLGIKPKALKGAKRAQAEKMAVLKNTADLDYDEGDKDIDFLTATEKDFEGMTRRELAQKINDKFDASLNIKGRSKAEIIKSGIALAEKENEDG